MKMRLLIVRHGLTTWNTEGRFQGQTDVPLNHTGRRQAAALAKRLAGEQIDAAYASDLSRAWETATTIIAQHDCPLHPEPGLREMSFGDWEGLTYAEIQERDAQLLAHWEADELTVSAPAGETLQQIAQRVQSVLARLIANHPEGTALLVAHGGSLQVLLCQALGLPLQSYWQFHLDQASLSEVRFYPQGAILNLFNDTCHLENQE
jgi:alpha-ribazole phosphatase